MSSTTLTTKGQVTLPAAIRSRLRLVQGMELDVQETPDGNVMLIPRAKKTGDLRALKGSINYSGPPISLKDMERGLLEALTVRLERIK